jgi:hypothetical protein
MTDLIHFTPRAELDCRENLRGFIGACRNQLTAFGAELPFDQDVWDVTEALDLKAKNGRCRVVFSTWNSVNDSTPASMAEPFLSFAKAYIRYQHGLRPTLAIAQRVAALRALEAALVGSGGPADPTLVSAQTLDRAAQLARGKFTGGVAYRVGGQLKLVADFLAGHQLMSVPVKWHNFIPRPGDTQRVGEEFDRRRLSKLPSPAALEALAKVFTLASDLPDVLVSSLAAIMCSAPDRINEVLHLEADCEVSQAVPSSGETAYGLRWRPSKGADPMVKWIIPSMADVVRQALRNLRRITDDARVVARWYETHPEQLYLAAHLEHLRAHKRLNSKEVGEVLFADRVPGDAGQRWCERHNLQMLSTDGIRSVAFIDLERAVLSMLPRGFPIANRERGLKYSDALCLLLRNSLHGRKASYRCAIELVQQSVIADGLGARSRFGMTSIFDRFGFVEDDGRPIRIRTHQFRHYLNTLAQMGGLSQLDIAKWSGRKDISQNAVYDHESDRDVLARLRDGIGDEMKMFPPLAARPERVPLLRAKFRCAPGVAVHTTDFGYCIHDFAMLPCQLHRDCINCDEQVCVKGEEFRESNIRRYREETRALLAEAMAAKADDVAGANRWVEHQQLTLARLDQLCAILDDPRVPAGAAIRPSVVPASRLEQARFRRLEAGTEKPK